MGFPGSCHNFRKTSCFDSLLRIIAVCVSSAILKASSFTAVTVKIQYFTAVCYGSVNGIIVAICNIPSVEKVLSKERKDTNMNHKELKKKGNFHYCGAVVLLLRLHVAKSISTLPSL